MEYIVTNLLNKLLQNQTLICNNVITVKQKLDKISPTTYLSASGPSGNGTLTIDYFKGNNFSTTEDGIFFGGNFRNAAVNVPAFIEGRNNVNYAADAIIKGHSNIIWNNNQDYNYQNINIIGHNNFTANGANNIFILGSQLSATGGKSSIYNSYDNFEVNPALQSPQVAVFLGHYNKTTNASQYQIIVGNGTSEQNTSDSLLLDYQGNLQTAGIMKAPNFMTTTSSYVAPRIVTTTIQGNTYNLKYSDGDLHKITLTNNTTVTVVGIPEGQSILLYCDNAANKQLSFGGKIILNESGNFLISFMSINNTIKIIGQPVEI